jgi:micrococcal nuclease
MSRAIPRLPDETPQTGATFPPRAVQMRPRGGGELAWGSTVGCSGVKTSDPVTAGAAGSRFIEGEKHTGLEMTTPAGWYPDPERHGQLRYWDGAAWTEHRAPMYSSAPQHASPGNSHGSWFGRHKFLTALAAAVTVFLVIGGIGAALESSEVDQASNGKQQSEPDASPGAQGSEGDKPPEDREATEPTKPKADRSPSKEERPTATPEPKPRRYLVLDVIDGDTVEVGYRGGTTIRVIGIDTPETVSPNTPDECFGAAASAAANRMLRGSKVALEFDPSQGRLDKYGRTLAYLRVPGTGDFGLAMIRRGFAAEYTYDTAYRYQARYQAAEARARAADRGLWGKCGGPDVPLKQPPAPAKPERPNGKCAPGYDPCVPPYPPDLDCADVDGPIDVTGSDPHGLDGDGDGVACEPY